MPINIPVKFDDSMASTVLTTRDNSWKLQMFTKSWAISLQILHRSTSEIIGAQIHMVTIIPVRFHDSRPIMFFSMRNTSWTFYIFIKSRAYRINPQAKSQMHNFTCWPTFL
jgi:hypothetical protein